MRWGIDVEFRGFKQTIDKHMLRCRNLDRLFAELDWSLRGMAVAELLALIEQTATGSEDKGDEFYDPKDRSLVNLSPRTIDGFERNGNLTQAVAMRSLLLHAEAS